MLLSAIIRDFHVVGVSFPPREADAPLIVDPNAVLSFAVSGQLLKPIRRGDP